MRWLLLSIGLLVGCADRPEVQKVTTPAPENKLPRPTEPTNPGG